MSMDTDDEEKLLIASIQEIMRRAELEAKPFADRLAEIRSAKAGPWTIARAQAEAAGIDWSRVAGKME
jgi:hypothetical protein